MSGVFDEIGKAESRRGCEALWTGGRDDDWCVGESGLRRLVDRVELCDDGLVVIDGEVVRCVAVADGHRGARVVGVGAGISVRVVMTVVMDVAMSGSGGVPMRDGLMVAIDVQSLVDVFGRRDGEKPDAGNQPDDQRTSPRRSLGTRGQRGHVTHGRRPA